MTTHGSRAFGHSSPSTCQTLSNGIHFVYLLTDAIYNIFTFCFTSTCSVFEVVRVNVLYKLLTYLLTDMGDGGKSH